MSKATITIEDMPDNESHLEVNFGSLGINNESSAHHAAVLMLCAWAEREIQKPDPAGVSA